MWKYHPINVSFADLAAGRTNSVVSLVPGYSAQGAQMNHTPFCFLLMLSVPTGTLLAEDARITMLSQAAATCVDESSSRDRQQTAAPFMGEVSDWNGFTRTDFQINGRPVLVVQPERPAVGLPWVWHGEFFGHKPAPDIALLKLGYHVVYTRVPDLLGCPQAVQHWNEVYAELTGKYGLHAQPALVGLSRGGLYCYNWAIANPQRVACIYGDAPVCDFRSWPGGFGAGNGSPRDWQLVRSLYGFDSDDEARAWQGNPVDNLAPLAAADVPLLHVYGTADEIVPWDENTGVVARRYRQLGGAITLIAKPGVGHHPHGLEDSTPIVDFIRRHTQQDDRAGVTLRVMTWNVHHCRGVDDKLDIERIARVIADVAPDLVALQEVDQNTARTGNVDQPAELARLTGMEVVFGPNIELQGGKYGNAVLSRLPITQSRNHQLPNIDQGEQRGVLEVVIELPDRRQLTLLATHFDHRRDARERVESAQFVNQLLEQRETEGCLLAGDLNAGPNDAPLQLLWSEWTNTSSTVLPTIPVAEPQRQIDFVLVRPGDRIRPVTAEVLDEATASDHRAVVTTLRWLAD
jgi:endonuclease/exonuclease/phosphatase family metal-dependent hydrolase/pimeloyl-ACP methyl ester carboxylesterase